VSDALSKCNSVDFITNPINGFSLRNAMTWYGDQHMAGRYIGWRFLARVPAGQEGALQPWQHNELVSFRAALLNDLLARLKCGLLVAKGFRSGDLSLTPIPREWWIGAHVDVEENSAEAHGTKLTGILVFPAPGVSLPVKEGRAKEGRASAKTGPRPATRDRVAGEMLRDLRAGKTTAEELASRKQMALADAYEVNRETARRARDLALSEFASNPNSDK
jgi:hypothetical protein